MEEEGRRVQDGLQHDLLPLLAGRGAQKLCHSPGPVPPASRPHIPQNPAKDALLEREGTVNFLLSFLISESLHSSRREIPQGRSDQT